MSNTDTMSRCRNCRHWVEIEPNLRLIDGAEGSCDRMFYADEPPVGSLAMPYHVGKEPMALGVYTRNNFGCVMFAEKRGKVNE